MQQNKEGRRDRAGFTCIHCKRQVQAGGWGTGTKNRNHCPYCLWSRHVDDEIGDRRSACRAPMEPIAVAVRSAGEWCVVHRCTGCGKIRINRIAGDDDERALLGLALRPLASPAFPLG
ncbi:MAG: RNHCP domain-containing protein [Planctomycetota bacterium]